MNEIWAHICTGRRDGHLPEEEPAVPPVAAAPAPSQPGPLPPELGAMQAIATPNPANIAPMLPPGGVV